MFRTLNCIEIEVNMPEMWTCIMKGCVQALIYSQTSFSLMYHKVILTLTLYTINRKYSCVVIFVCSFNNPVGLEL